MNETHSEREVRRQEALEWWHTEVRLSSFARHLSGNARKVSSNPALRYESRIDAEADRWRRAAQIFGNEAVQTLRIDLLIEGQPMFDRPGLPAVTGEVESLGAESAPVVATQLLEPTANVSSASPERSPLPRPISRPTLPAASESETVTVVVQGSESSESETMTVVVQGVQSGSPASGSAVSQSVVAVQGVQSGSPASGSAVSQSVVAVQQIDPPAGVQPAPDFAWSRLNRDKLTPLYHRNTGQPVRPTGGSRWFGAGARMHHVPIEARIGMAVVAVGCLAALVLTVF